MASDKTLSISALIEARGWKRETVMAIFPDEAVGPGGGLCRKRQVPEKRVLQVERTKRFQQLQEKFTFLSAASVLDRGWTKTQIDRLLGEPDKTAENPHYKCAPNMRLYSLTRVKKIESKADFQEQKAKTEKRRDAAAAKAYAVAVEKRETARCRDELERAERERSQQQAEEARRSAQEKLTAALVERMEARWGNARFLSMFPLARSLGRKLRLFVGPTNSGKTHAAMELLRERESAVYLAPLRLLALEGRDRIEAMGIPCSMLTGEERQIREDARATASTIEMLNERETVDLAIIDEIQMLHDRDRGWAWVNALVGAPAREVVMTGSEDAIPAVQSIADYLEEPLEIVRFERHNPLTVDDSPTPLTELKPHTALIAFSRREVLDLKAQLAKMGRSVAVIYGALGPEVRREEARKFRDGEAEILVATDAIGMGLNLPIRHIVFWTTTKWDGKRETQLSPALARQIAGRAGRFGLHDTGHAGAIAKHDLDALRRLLEGELPPGEMPLAVMPSLAQITLLSDVLKTEKLAKILSVYANGLTRQEALFKSGSLEEMLVLADALDQRSKLSLGERYVLCLAPVNQKSPSVVAAWDRFAAAVQKKTPLSAPEIGKHYATGIAHSTDSLQSAEDGVQVQNLYRWLAYRFPAIFVGAEASARSTKILNDFISRSLSHGALARRCTGCGKVLPVEHRHAQCDPCFRKSRSWDGDDDWY